LSAMEFLPNVAFSAEVPTMRGVAPAQGQLFSVVVLAVRVPADHPIRIIRPIVDAVLAELAADLDALYAVDGRPSIPRSNSSGRSCSRSCTACGVSGS
jgi:hypothetical protein